MHHMLEIECVGLLATPTQRESGDSIPCHTHNRDMQSIHLDRGSIEVLSSSLGEELNGSMHENALSFQRMHSRR